MKSKKLYARDPSEWRVREEWRMTSEGWWLMGQKRRMNGEGQRLLLDSQDYFTISLTLCVWESQVRQKKSFDWYWVYIVITEIK